MHAVQPLHEVRGFQCTACTNLVQGNHSYAFQKQRQNEWREILRARHIARVVKDEERECNHEDDTIS